jgi:hypothetical protein
MKKLLLSFLLVTININILNATFLPEILQIDEKFENTTTKAKILDPVKARDYTIPLNNYFGDHPKEIGHCKQSIYQLMNRFNIFNKNILSIGAGGALEEIWFTFEQDNNLTLFDLDEHSTLEHRLLTLNIKPDQILPDVQYFKYLIGDFFHPENDPIHDIDVVYVSSLTPVEIRRAQIIKAFRELPHEAKKEVDFLHSIFGKSIGSWPSWKKIFDPTLLAKCLTPLTKSGLFIYQIYCGGVDCIKNKQFTQMLKREFVENGLIPLEFYTYPKLPGIMLLIGIKEDPYQAFEFYEQIKNGPQITSFHGRANLGDEAIKVFSLDEESIE